MGRLAGQGNLTCSTCHGTMGAHLGPGAQKLPYYDGIKKSRGLYDSFKKSPVYIKIPLYDGVKKSPGICLYDLNEGPLPKERRLQKCRGIYFKTIRHKTYRYIDTG